MEEQLLKKTDSTGPAIGRFAPSPTGPLHFGSLVAAVGSFCWARRAGGRWLLRIEDLDTPRVLPGAAEEILRNLEALGLEWDGEVVWQSRRTESYEAALDILRAQGLLFPCGCSRREIIASAPHPGEGGPVYPGTCRHGLPPGRRPRALRLRVPSGSITFRDAVYGRVEQHLPSIVGDFILRRADGVFAYQLAAVVDDIEGGINQVVRGEDLISSTPRQIFLHNCLHAPVPSYVHLPLALTPAGDKISKRHGAVPAGSGESLWQVLRFLGQAIPDGLRGAPSREILAWGVTHFDLGRIPTRSRAAGISEGVNFSSGEGSPPLLSFPSPY